LPGLQSLTGRPRRGVRVALGFAYDAWVFFTLLLLLAGVVSILWPVRRLDRWLGTRLTGPLVDLVEAIGDL
jgi:hypothetical protein